jgi:fluoroacetyl-CoA thioesterase
MREGLRIGHVHEFAFRVPREKTVPFLYPESPEFKAMPEVFATGFMVGLMEWCCVLALKPFLDEGEGSLGTLIDVTHIAATPPGMTVTVTATVAEIVGRRIVWHVVARDEQDVIGEGRHGRNLVLWERFQEKVAQKAAAVS